MNSSLVVLRKEREGVKREFKKKLPIIRNKLKVRKME